MGTLKPLQDDEPVTYGITREVNTSSFLDVHFGEFTLLWSDLRSAGDLRAFFGYLLRPPGWKPVGEQQTAAALKQRAMIMRTGSRA